MAKFKFWPHDKARGREVWLLPEDEDALCDALRREYGEVLVVPDWGTFNSPRAPVFVKPSEIPVGYSMDKSVLCATTLEFYIRWPGWRLALRRRPQDDREGRKAWGLPLPPPLSLRLSRSRLSDGPFRHKWCIPGCLLSGFLSVSYSTDGPYAVKQAEFARFIWRTLGKITTNRLVIRRYDEQGRFIRDDRERPGAPNDWAGRYALKWALEPGRHLIRSEWASPDVLRAEYRPAP